MSTDFHKFCEFLLIFFISFFSSSGRIQIDFFILFLFVYNIIILLYTRFYSFFCTCERCLCLPWLIYRQNVFAFVWRVILHCFLLFSKLIKYFLIFIFLLLFFSSLFFYFLIFVFCFCAFVFCLFYYNIFILCFCVRVNCFCFFAFLLFVSLFYIFIL